jgi:hypothetical protein
MGGVCQEKISGLPDCIASQNLERGYRGADYQFPEMPPLVQCYPEGIKEMRREGEKKRGRIGLCIETFSPKKW